MSNLDKNIIPTSLVEEFHKLSAHLDIRLLDEFATEYDYLYCLTQATKEIKELNEYKQSIESEKSKKEKIKEEEAFLSQSKRLENELKATLASTNEKLNWAEKVERLKIKYSKEKDQKVILETFIQSQNKKIEVLVDHVEKLMKAIKVESQKKLQISVESRKVKKDLDATKDKLERQIKITKTQHRAIEEVMEGSRVLEDQLRLMDEKFLELRTKMEVTRDHFTRKIKKINQENMELRVKFTQATGKALDQVRLNKNQSFEQAGQREDYSPFMSTTGALQDLAISIPAPEGRTPYFNGDSNSPVADLDKSKKSMSKLTPVAISAFQKGLSTKGESLNPQRSVRIIVDDDNQVDNSGTRARPSTGKLSKSGSSFDMKTQSSPIRPHSAMNNRDTSHTHHAHTNQTHQAGGKLHLNEIVNRIKRKNQGERKGNPWTAERLSDLLERCQG